MSKRKLVVMIKLRGKEKYVIALNLLTDSAGQKMGKTEGNMVSLDDSSTTTYGKIMSWSDDLISLGYELCTDLSDAQIEKNIKQGPKMAKMGLARAIVTLCFSKAEAVKAEDDFVAKFQKKEMPKNLKVFKAKKDLKFADFLVNHGLVKSKSEFKRLVESGSISLNDEKITD